MSSDVRVRLTSDGWTMDIDTGQLEVFQGRLSTTAGDLYVRAARPSADGDWSLRGTVRGPHSRVARTLAANYPIRDCGPGESLLGRAWISEPNLWSTDSPSLYDVGVEWVCGGEVAASVTRTFGFRNLGARGASLFRDGRRIVLRGVFAHDPAGAQFEHWREQRAAMVTAPPGDPVLAQASREGVQLVVDLTPLDLPEIEREVARCGAWPAVVAVLLPAGAGVARRAFPGMLRVEVVSRLPDGPGPADREAFWIDAARLLEAPREAWPETPVVAYRRVPRAVTLAEARKACDDLQRALAAAGDFAGYCIVPDETCEDPDV